ncbi:MAG: hypothetical protein C0615_01240 [Desulfuromonas sp.]|nr:MAG: hypothetical protein C0615_01240 [Desulfuromonas sp.]
MIVNKRLLTIVCCLLTLGFMFPLTASARSVGFASMELVDTSVWNLPDQKQRYWQRKLEDMTKVLFDIKYSSFTRVASKLNLSNLKPRTLVIYTENGERKLRPYPTNRGAIKAFHQNFSEQGETYLKSVCQANQSEVIVFDSLEPWVEEFVTEQNDRLEVRIHTYYADSNAQGLNFVYIDQEVMNNFSKLKQKVHQSIIKAMEELMQNQGSYVAEEETTAGSPAAAAAPSSDW